MLSRQAIWQTLASAAVLCAAQPGFAQASKTLPTSVPIVPVSLTNDQIAAVVNGEKILVGDVRKILDARPYPLTLTEEQKKEMRKAAVDALVEDALMRQYLNEQVPPNQVSQADFDKEYNLLVEALKKENMTIEQYNREQGQDAAILRRDIVARLQWRILLTRYFPDAKAKQYYDANKPFFDKVEVRASHILIKLPPNPSVEQRSKAMQSMQIWRQEIIAGKVKFEDVAKQFSQCPSKEKKEAGDIGRFTYKFMVVPEFAKAAYSMKPGEISDVVQTVFGLHLIKVTERTNGEPSTYEAIREAVREVWAKDEDLLVRIVAQQRKTGKIEVRLQ